MRRLALASTLFLAGCAARPQQPPAPQPVIVAPTPHVRGKILGLTSSELISRLGNPVLQVREGTSLKLQFRSSRCVLDAYLYPTGSGGVMRVTHVDTRALSGVDTDQATCISAFEYPS